MEELLYATGVALVHRSGLRTRDSTPLHSYRKSATDGFRNRSFFEELFEQWLGHSDMESTMRYLKPSRSQKVRDKVNGIFA